MDEEKDKELFWIAREGLKAPLPKDWKPCKTTDTEEIYYFNFASGESTWDHPCDEYYRKLYEENKKRLETRKMPKEKERKKHKKEMKRLKAAQQGDESPRPKGVAGALGPVGSISSKRAEGGGLGSLNDGGGGGGAGGGGRGLDGGAGALGSLGGSKLDRKPLGKPNRLGSLGGGNDQEQSSGPRSGLAPLGGPLSGTSGGRNEHFEPNTLSTNNTDRRSNNNNIDGVTESYERTSVSSSGSSHFASKKFGRGSVSSSEGKDGNDDNNYHDRRPTTTGSSSNAGSSSSRAAEAEATAAHEATLRRLKQDHEAAQERLLREHRDKQEELKQELSEQAGRKETELRRRHEADLAAAEEKLGKEFHALRSAAETKAKEEQAVQRAALERERERKSQEHDKRMAELGVDASRGDDAVKRLSQLQRDLDAARAQREEATRGREKAEHSEQLLQRRFTELQKKSSNSASSASAVAASEAKWEAKLRGAEDRLATAEASHARKVEELEVSVRSLKDSWGVADKRAMDAETALATERRSGSEKEEEARRCEAARQRAEGELKELHADGSSARRELDDLARELATAKRAAEDLRLDLKSARAKLAASEDKVVEEREARANALAELAGENANLKALLASTGVSDATVMAHAKASPVAPKSAGRSTTPGLADDGRSSSSSPPPTPQEASAGGAGDENVTVHTVEFSLRLSEKSPDSFGEAAQAEFLKDVAAGLGLPAGSEERVSISGMSAGSLIVETQVVGFETPEAASEFSAKAARAPPIDEAKYGPCAFHKLPVSVPRTVSASSSIAKRAGQSSMAKNANSGLSGHPSVAELRAEVAAKTMELAQAAKDLAAAEEAMAELRALHSAAAKERDEAGAGRAEAERLLRTERVSGEAVKAERAALEERVSELRGAAADADERLSKQGSDLATSGERAAEAEAENARLRDVVKARDETLAAAEAAVAEGSARAEELRSSNATLEAAVQKLKATAGAPALPGRSPLGKSPPMPGDASFAAEVRSLKDKLEAATRERDGATAELAAAKRKLEEATAAANASSSSASSSASSMLTSPVAKSMAEGQLSLVRMELETRQRDLADERKASVALKGEKAALAKQVETLTATGRQQQAEKDALEEKLAEALSLTSATEASAKQRGSDQLSAKLSAALNAQADLEEQLAAVRAEAEELNQRKLPRAEAEAAAAKKAADTSRADCEAAKQEVKELRGAAEDAASKQRLAEQEQEFLEGKCRRLEGEKGSLEAKCKALRGEAEGLAGEKHALEREGEESAAAAGKTAARLREVERKVAGYAGQVERGEAELARLRSELEREQERSRERSAAVSSAASAAVSASNASSGSPVGADSSVALAALQEEKEALQQQYDSKLRQVKQLQAKYASLAEDHGRTKAELDAKTDECLRLEEALRAQKGEVATLREELRVASERPLTLNMGGAPAAHAAAPTRQAAHSGNMAGGGGGGSASSSSSSSSSSEMVSGGPVVQHAVAASSQQQQSHRQQGSSSSTSHHHGSIGSKLKAHRRSQVQQQAAPSNSDADDAHGIAVDTPLSATSAVTMAASPRVQDDMLLYNENGSSPHGGGGGGGGPSAGMLSELASLASHWRSKLKSGSAALKKRKREVQRLQGDLEERRKQWRRARDLQAAAAEAAQRGGGYGSAEEKAAAKASKQLLLEHRNVLDSETTELNRVVEHVRRTQKWLAGREAKLEKLDALVRRVSRMRQAAAANSAAATPGNGGGSGGSSSDDSMASTLTQIEVSRFLSESVVLFSSPFSFFLFSLSLWARDEELTLRTTTTNRHPPTYPFRC